MIEESFKEQYSLRMELFLVALALLALSVIVAIYLEPPVVFILIAFFIFVLWKWEEISA